MQSHVKILGILYIIFGALGVLGGLIALMVFGGIAGIVGANAPGEEAAVAIPVLGAIGGLIFLLVFLLSIPGIIIGWGLTAFKPWARILGIVFSGLNLLNVPFGTILGIYGLWVLLSNEGSMLFERGYVAAAPPQWQPPAPPAGPYVK